MAELYSDVAVVIPVFNEAQTIRGLLESLETQTRFPKEVLIVDGGSQDETVSVVKGYLQQSVFPYEIRLLRLEGRAFPGRARNEGVRRTRCSLIACADAGARLDPQWLEDLAGPLRTSEADLVIGTRKSDARTFFERCAFFVHIGMVRRDDIPFQGSASIAFRRRFWESVSGYPERLYPCEDKFFLTLALKKKARIHLSKGGIVYWRPRSHLGSFFLQYLGYGRGDGKARFYPERHFLRLAAYGGTLLLWAAGKKTLSGVGLIGLAAYWVKMTWRGWREFRDLRVWFLLPILFLTKDVAQMIGYTTGALARKERVG